MGRGSSTRRGGGRKVRALPRKFVFLGFRREDSGMSGILPGCPAQWGCSKTLCKKVRVHFLGRQHPSPNVKTLCSFEPQIWPEIMTSRDAESTCFKGSMTSCDVINFGHLNLGRKDHIT